MPSNLARLPPALVIGGVVAALLVVAGVGAAVAIVARDRNGQPDPPTPGELAALRVIEVSNISVELPSDWEVLRQDADTIVAREPTTGGLVWLRSGRVGQALTLDAVQQAFLDKAAAEAPDARICAGPEAAALPGGPPQGRYFTICSTLTPQGGGRAARLADAYYVGLDGTGTTIGVMQLTAAPDRIESLAETVRRLPAPRWKLFGV